MTLDTLISSANSHCKHLEAYKEKTGIQTHLLNDETELPNEISEAGAEDEITKRLASQIGNAETPKVEASRLMLNNATTKQKSYLRQLIERSLDKAFEPVF
jgi:hypothetical protein